MIEIREIKPEEYEFLREMLYEAIYFADDAERLPKSVVDEPHLAKYVENFGRHGDCAFVFAAKDELIGAAWSRLFSADKKGYGYIDAETPEFSVAIYEKYRNQGFGRRLMRNLFAKLKSAGYLQISLSVDKRNPAVNLYHRLGFEMIAEEGTALTMLKKL